MVEKIKSEANFMQINGKAINGRGFANLVRAYVHAINEGVPTIHSAWKRYEFTPYTCTVGSRG
jgi:hypothetical protein